MKKFILKLLIFLKLYTPKTRKKKKKWSQSDIDKFETYYYHKIGINFLTTELQRTPKSVISKARRLGYGVKKGKLTRKDLKEMDDKPCC